MAYPWQMADKKKRPLHRLPLRLLVAKKKHRKNRQNPDI